MKSEFANIFSEVKYYGEELVSTNILSLEKFVSSNCFKYIMKKKLPSKVIIKQAAYYSQIVNLHQRHQRKVTVQTHVGFHFF